MFVYMLLVGGALAVTFWLGTELPTALMTIAPIILIGWVAAQQRGFRPTAERIRDIGQDAVPRLAQQAYLLGAAGFIGITAAALAPVDDIATWLAGAGIPNWVVVAALPVIISLGGQVALSPMVMVVFLAAVVTSLPQLPARPEYVALALGAGWSLSITAAPNSTAALLLAGATGLPPTRLTWAWNGTYSLCVMASFAGLCWAIVG